MTSEPNLIDEVRAFCDRLEMSNTAFGKAVAGDPCLLERMIGRQALGRAPASKRLEERVRTGMARLAEQHRAKVEKAFAALPPHS